MYKVAYAIKNWTDTVEISLSEASAQEILMDYALGAAYEIFLNYYNYWGNSLEGAMRDAQRELDHWQIWEYELI